MDSNHPLLDNLPPGSLAALEVPKGRPSTKTPEKIEKILDLIAETNLSLREICKRNDDLPNITTLYHWLRDDEELYVAVYRALHLRCDDLAWDCLLVAENTDRDYAADGDGKTVVNREHLSRTQMKLDQMHWIIEQLRPDRYGDKRGMPVEKATTVISIEAPIARIEDHPQYAVLQAYSAESK